MEPKKSGYKADTPFYTVPQIPKKRGPSRPVLIIRLVQSVLFVTYSIYPERLYLSISSPLS